MKHCACCRQPADHERDGSWFCLECVTEVERMIKAASPDSPYYTPPDRGEPVETIEIPGLATIKRYKQ